MSAKYLMQEFVKNQKNQKSLILPAGNRINQNKNQNSLQFIKLQFFQISRQ